MRERLDALNPATSSPGPGVFAAIILGMVIIGLIGYMICAFGVAAPTEVLPEGMASKPTMALPAAPLTGPLTPPLSPSAVPLANATSK